MKVTLLQYTPEPIKAIYLACRTCYSKLKPSEMGEVSEEKMLNLIKHTMSSGHHSVLEHATFSFAIEGVSRALTHQLVRHRIASYAQQSQRYVDFTKTETPTYTIPPKIKGENKKKYEEIVARIFSLYNDMVNDGVEPEDARYILPNAAHTNIIVTMNYREIVNFCRVRLCYRAQWEIFDMTKMMKSAIKEVSPFLGGYLSPKCQHLGYCDETEPCGKYKFPPESSVVKGNRKGF